MLEIIVLGGALLFLVVCVVVAIALFRGAKRPSAVPQPRPFAFPRATTSDSLWADHQEREAERAAVEQKRKLDRARDRLLDFAFADEPPKA